VNPILFVSDLHLSVERPDINQAFYEFLAGRAAAAQALYVLGDLFDYWPGDDDDDPFHATVVDALGGLTRRGTGLFVMRGNRDFLIGDRFAAATGATLIDDPTLVEVCGGPTLLMHGDTLCTYDVDYLRFRGTVRDPEWQGRFLAKPLDERRQIIAGLRAGNAQEKKRKTEAEMDAAPLGIEAALRAHGYPRLIHGHTHRPALHYHTVDGRRCERWVLADWHKSASCLECSPDGCRVVHLTLR
jgi:UDP-2,3-diacylglucosamine hydrolase